MSRGGGRRRGSFSSFFLLARLSPKTSPPVLVGGNDNGTVHKVSLSLSEDDKEFRGRFSGLVGSEFIKSLYDVSSDDPPDIFLLSCSYGGKNKNNPTYYTLIA